MSRGVPIAQRPDLKDASLSARLDAVFGSLGASTGGGGWSLRQDVQPFRAGGGIEEYKYSSDEEDPNEGLKPLMPSRLVDSDDEDANAAGQDDGVPPLERADPDDDTGVAGFGARTEERAARERERLRCSLGSRRAFEAEAEEDEFDRFATGTMDLRNRLSDSKPPGFTEVPLHSAWERMRGRGRSPEEDEGEEEEAAARDGAMAVDAATAADTTTTTTTTSPHVTAELDAGSPCSPDGGRGTSGSTGTAAAASVGAPSPSRKRSRGAGGQAAAVAVAEAVSGGGGAAGHAVASGVGDVEMMAAVSGEGGAGPGAPGDAAAVDGAAVVGSGLAAPAAEPGGPATGVGGTQQQQQPRQRGGRRVQWADFVAAGRPADEPGPSGRDSDPGPAGTRQELDSSRHGQHGRGGGGGGRGGGAGGPSGRSGRVRLDWQRRGFVPDHVRNPHKYTMYTLDEELVVGGGETHGRNGRNGGAAVGGGQRWRGLEARQEEAEMREALAQAQSAVAASERAEHDPERVETSFGSGITFRSRAQRRVAGEAAAPPTGDGSEDGGEAGQVARSSQARAARGAALGGLVRRGAFAEGEDGGGGDDGGGDGGGVAGGGGDGQAAEGVRVRGGARRHFRSRRPAEEEAEDGGGGNKGGDGDTGQVRGPDMVGRGAGGDAMEQD